jgi:hypothetical protein
MHRVRRWVVPLVVVGATGFCVPAGLAGPRCQTSPVPQAYSIKGVTDNGARVGFDLYVLLDGISQSRAKGTLSAVTAAYAPLGIDVRVRGYRTLRIADDRKKTTGPTGEIGRLMRAMKSATRGARPRGSDAVLMLTNKSLWIPGPDGQPQYGFDGQAECIGGVRWAEESYALANGNLGGTAATAHRAAITATHELGHLLGAEHHHANCVEGPAPRVCTVMLAASHSLLDVNSTTFGTVEGAIVRGHAVTYAKP